MARININVGTNANDGTGDDLRTAMQKINTNFTELYGTTAEANDLLEDSSPQLGGDLDVNGYSIISSSNGNISIVPNGTGLLTLGALKVNGTTVSSDTSTKITLAESVDVTGTLSASTINVNLLQSDDSSAIQINDSVNISGVLNVKDLVVNEINSNDSSAIEIKDNLSVQGNLKSSNLITNLITSDDSTEIVIDDSVFVSGILSAVNINTNVISSPDSSAIQIEDGMNVAGTITANNVVTGNILTGVKTSTIISNVLDIDFSYGTHIVNHNDNISSVTFSNVSSNKSGQVTVILTQDGTGGRTITGSYLTAGGLGLDISTAINAVNIITFLTRDNSTFYGFSNGKNFS